MLGSIRKFSGSIYAKILLGIIIIPFIFWGMGSSIRGGSKNIVVVIDKEKYSIQDFSEYIKRTAIKKVEANEIQDFLSNFIGEKLIEKEIEFFEIKLSDSSLKKLLKHQKDFKRDNKFSRTEYEKFLIKNNITAIKSICPVIAVHPSNGGVAPAAPPITIFCGVLLFKYKVYIKA